MHVRIIKAWKVMERLGKRHSGPSQWLIGLLLLLAVLSVLVASSYSWAQTREECNKCCKEMFSDEYYAEQCRLKCFRNPAHCAGLKPSRTTAPTRDQPEQQVPPREVVKPEVSQPRPESRPPQDTTVQRPAPPQRRPPAFRWPETLVLTPGREWEAAGQILAANGIPPQHPNFTAGMKAIEEVLTDFARRNPGGGDLPVEQLERILGQLRK